MAGGIGDDVDALMMNAPTQQLGDAEGSDDSPLSAMHGPAEAHPNALATALANEDSRARTEALRDAASAAAALRAARGEHEVVPLPEPNPYALAAPVSTPPSLRKPKRTNASRALRRKPRWTSLVRPDLRVKPDWNRPHSSVEVEALPLVNQEPRSSNRKSTTLTRRRQPSQLHPLGCTN